MFAPVATPSTFHHLFLTWHFLFTGIAKHPQRGMVTLHLSTHRHTMAMGLRQVGLALTYAFGKGIESRYVPMGSNKHIEALGGSTYQDIESEHSLLESYHCVFEKILPAFLESTCWTSSNKLPHLKQQAIRRRLGTVMVRAPLKTLKGRRDRGEKRYSKVHQECEINRLQVSKLYQFAVHDFLIYLSHTVTINISSARGHHLDIQVQSVQLCAGVLNNSKGVGNR